MEARRAREAARIVSLAALRAEPTGWKRAAEVAGIVAVGMLAAAGVFPW
jgi:hypothetical protein